jgi:hypothetical protein
MVGIILTAQWVAFASPRYCPVDEDAAEAWPAQSAQLCGISIPVLKCCPRGGFVEHRLASGALGAARSEKYIAYCTGSGPIFEAQHDQAAWPLEITLETL